MKNLDSDLIIASCDCLTKTPEIKFHAKGCKYRLIMERDNAIDDTNTLRDLRNSALKERNELESALISQRRRMGEDYDTLAQKLTDVQCAAIDQIGKRDEALVWLEGYFTMHIDGGGNHACPWCYMHGDSMEGKPQPWRWIKHSEECVIGKAMKP